jgi:hypothetical protein
MFDEPIITVAQAKKFFMTMGCSGFHMSREYPERYDEYKKLNIPIELETEWRQEQVDTHMTEIMEANDSSRLWMIHSHMAELVKELRTQDVLVKMLKATQFIRDKVPLADKVIVSETINGRQDRRYRSGLIYLAYDLNSPSAAKAFAELSSHLAVYVEGKTKERERCRQAKQTCNEIVVELGL